ncbi:MAG: hypothetical protein KA770_00285 [Shewanella sp.]|nr:hypothetical protein [Shewanella sp.]
MTDASDILDLANKRVKKAKDSWSEVYQAAKDDLHFLSDKPHAQWDSKEASDRITIGRPALQIDQLTQFIHQVSNDIRMNTPTIKIIPDGLDSDPETAEAIAGRIKAIEYKSNADAAYDMAADFSVKSSIGFIRVDRGYVDDESFNQELKICRVVNPMAVLIDPDSTEPDGSDAKFAFVFDEISKDDFEKRWPDATPKSFGDETAKSPENGNDKIVIAEYFCIVDDENDMGLLDDGSIEVFDKKKKYKSRRKVSKRKVMHYTLSADDILAETTFPGKYVPIVPVYGEESWENGTRHLHSLIRKSKSAQQMYNLWKSLETELLLKQQQAPVQAAVGQMRGFDDDWKHPDKAMVLYYNQTDINGDRAPAPQRLQPPTIPTGIVNAARETVDDIKATMGLYNASIGVKSNETSGIAIQSRQKEGDVATFHFGDNLIRSITHVGKIIVCALPEVEDTARVVQTIGLEDEMKPIGINGQVVDKQEKTFDFTKGRYDVRVTTGSSFTTQRQEAAALYMETLKILPPEIAVQTLDLVFKYQDAPGSQALAARFKKLIDPKLLDEADREEGQPDPQVLQLTAQLQEVTAQAQQQIQALQAELQNKQSETQVKMAEVQIKAEEVKIKQDDMKLKLITALQPQQKEAAPQSSQPLPLATADESIEVLQARMIQKAQQDEQAQLKAQQDAEFEASREQREYEQEQQELQLKVADMQSRDMQARALIQGIDGIQQTLGVLVQSVQAPIDMVRDEQGNLVRIQ